jgi:hypothetical protein
VSYQPHHTAPPLARIPERGPVTADLQSVKERWLASRRHSRELEDTAREAQARLRAAERERDAAVLREDQALTDGGERPDPAALRRLGEAVRDRSFERDEAVARHARWVEEIRARELALRRYAEVHRLEIAAELLPDLAAAEQRARRAFRELDAAVEALGDELHTLDGVQNVAQGAQRPGAFPTPPGQRGLGDVRADLTRLAALPLVWLPEELRPLAGELGMVTEDRQDRRIPATDLARVVSRVTVTDGGGAPVTEADVMSALQAQLPGEEE